MTLNNIALIFAIIGQLTAAVTLELEERAGQCLLCRILW